MPKEIQDYMDVFIECPVGQLPTRKPLDQVVELKEEYKPQKEQITLLPQEDVVK